MALADQTARAKNHLSFGRDSLIILRIICRTKKPMPFVYVLGCTTPRGPISYVGWTLDIERRLNAAQCRHWCAHDARPGRGRCCIRKHSRRARMR